MKLRSSVAAVVATLCVVSTQARAHHHRHHFRHHVAHRAVSHDGGIALNVIAFAKERFAGLVSEFQAMGYAIGHPGCLSSGHMRNSKHHWGGACDLFNQIARNRTALRQPPPSVQIAVAARHGLIAGCAWRSPDCGHFEVPGPNGRRRGYAGL